MPNDERNKQGDSKQEEEAKKTEIEPLTDEALEDVSGGTLDSSDGCCSCTACSVDRA